MNRQTKWGLTVLAAMLAMPAALRAQESEQNQQAEQEQQAPPVNVRTGLVQQQTLQEHWTVVGELRPVRRSTVAAEGEGRVIETPTEEGQPAQAGESVLARLDDTWARLDLSTAEAQLAEARASVTEAQAQLELAETDLDYLRELAATNAAKPREVRTAEAEHAAAEANLQMERAALAAAEADLERANERLSKMRIVAPFDGVLVVKSIEVGEWVGQGDAVGELVSNGQIDAVVAVPERLVNVIQLGQQVHVRVPGIGQQVEGRVVAIVPSGEPAARTFPVKVRVNDLDGQLKPRMSVTAQVPTGKPMEAITVPRDAVLRRAGEASVWVVREGQAMPVSVEVLFGEGDVYAVRSAGEPLQPGTPVVIEGGERLMMPGQGVNVVDQE